MNKQQLIRKNQMAKIHIAKNQLKMDEETYRDMLHNIGGARSSAELSSTGLQKVLDHLVSIGAEFTPSAKHGKRPHNYNRLPAYVEKVEALLADMGLSWAYADSIARNITGGNGAPDKDPGVEKLAWVKQDKHWRAIITALHKEQEKRHLLESVQTLQQQYSVTDSDIEKLLTANSIKPEKWQRKTALLRIIRDALVSHYQKGSDHAA